ncbi:hypothetical protein EYF80_010997 [Liparis tanakae]|uniref:Uncharacterized protein n=1 Tax=Liparis tanakae TaxID=230148 RepID=A0A4Z2IM35_9TELE|nr:hypothetical protein EYF80_010997 [Liparis tanakae]
MEESRVGVVRQLVNTWFILQTVETWCLWARRRGVYFGLRVVSDITAGQRTLPEAAHRADMSRLVDLDMQAGAFKDSLLLWE